MGVWAATGSARRARSSKEASIVALSRFMGSVPKFLCFLERSMVGLRG